VSPDCSSRTRAASFGGTSSTRSPAATSCRASRCPSPPAPSTAQVRPGQPAAHATSCPACDRQAVTRSSSSGSSAVPIATAVCELLRGSIPIITAVISILHVVLEGHEAAAGMPDYSASARASFEPRRGKTSTTTDQYVRRVAVFLALWRPGAQVVVADLDGGAILATIRAAADAMPSPSLRCTVTALRSFLRFLHATGRTAASLVAAVPALKTWPRTTLPSVLPAGDARRLVAGCDPATARSRRDGAIVLVLVRLGLRASEVARLALDDIDWRAGEMTIKGKGGRLDRLPLPV